MVFVRWAIKKVLPLCCWFISVRDLSNALPGLSWLVLLITLLYLWINVNESATFPQTAGSGSSKASSEHWTGTLSGKSKMIKFRRDIKKNNSDTNYIFSPGKPVSNCNGCPGKLYKTILKWIKQIKLKYQL